VIKDGDGTLCVKLDGSNVLTPVAHLSTTADVAENERVSVLIKNHTATITGNTSSPAAKNSTVTAVTGRVENVEKVIGTFDEVYAKKGEFEGVYANKGEFDELAAKNATVEGRLAAAEGNITTLTADNVTINDTLSAVNGKFKNLEVENLTVTGRLEAAEGNIDNLTADNVTIREDLVAKDAEIDNLDADVADINNGNFPEASIDKLDSIYANINFANIGEAAFRKIFADSGLIAGLIVGDQKITGELVGVTIRGDRIIGNTIMADKLVIRGEDGLYYKLNYEGGALSAKDIIETVYHTVSYDTETGEYTVTDEKLAENPNGTIVAGVSTIDNKEVYAANDGTLYCKKDVYPDWAKDSLHGSIIAAKTITATQIAVQDLTAFGATIAGFNMSRDETIGLGKLYSGVKQSVDNTTRGIYMDDSGQIAIGDRRNFLKFYKVVDEDGNETLDEDGKPIYHLDISAESILFGGDSKTSAADLKALTEHVKIGTIIDDDTGDEKPCIELGEGDSDFKQVITNTKTVFTDGTNEGTKISADGLETPSATVRSTLQLGESPEKATVREITNFDKTPYDITGLTPGNYYITGESKANQGDYFFYVDKSIDGGQTFQTASEGHMYSATGPSFRWDSPNETELTPAAYITIGSSSDIIRLDCISEELSLIARLRIKKEEGAWIWSQRSNGNLGLIWKEVSD
jgi:hypothetical protein